MNIHPKTSGAAFGSALGVLIVSILASIHGVHLTAAADAAIPTFLSVFGAWLAPGDSTPSPVPPPPLVPASVIADPGAGAPTPTAPVGP